MSASPAQLGPYTLQQIVATGARSKVWLATGNGAPGGRSPPQVALKVPRTDAYREVLQREAKLLASIDHPSVVRLVDAAPDGTWMALERIHGVTIEQWAHGRPVGEILDLALALLSVVACLHAKGIVHADLKASNVLVSPSGHPCLVNLGVATQPGQKVEGFRGTLGYAAPELLAGRAPTTATDRYGLGAVLYRCLTGRTPFVAADPSALAYLPLASLPGPPAAHRPEMSASLNQLVLALLARDPARRPTDLDKVAEVLRRCKDEPAGPAVLGMEEEREELRKAVVGAADGEPRVAVVYGVPGCGRRTLIAETVEYARREGLTYLKGADPQAVLAAARSADGDKGKVAVLKASHPGTRHLAASVLGENLRCLLLLYSDRPMPDLVGPGVVTITPSPLELHDVVRLVRLHDADPALADSWSRQSLGLPIGILGRIRAWRRSQKLPNSEPRLPADAQKIYDALCARDGKPLPLAVIASALKVTELQLLDQCEVLFAENLVHATDDGRSIVAGGVPSPSGS